MDATREYKNIIRNIGYNDNNKTTTKDDTMEGTYKGPFNDQNMCNIDNITTTTITPTRDNRKRVEVWECKDNVEVCKEKWIEITSEGKKEGERKKEMKR